MTAAQPAIEKDYAEPENQTGAALTSHPVRRGRAPIPGRVRHSLIPTTRSGYLIAFWLALIHVLAAIGLALFPWPGWRIFLAAATLSFLGGAAVSVCFHRALAHRSVTLHPVMLQIFTFLAMFNGSSAPGAWIPTHRYHHATTDTHDDPSSPVWGGLFWAHLGWIYQAPPPPAKYLFESERKYFQYWSRLQIPLLAFALLIGAPFGWAAFFWLGSIRLAFSLHATALVNSVCHTRPGAPAGTDASRNVAWVALLQFTIGESWHQNHHALPGCAQLGWNWRQPDTGFLNVAISADTPLRISSGAPWADINVCAPHAEQLKPQALLLSRRVSASLQQVQDSGPLL